MRFPLKSLFIAVAASAAVAGCARQGEDIRVDETPVGHCVALIHVDRGHGYDERIAFEPHSLAPLLDSSSSIIDLGSLKIERDTNRISYNYVSHGRWSSRSSLVTGHLRNPTQLRECAAQGLGR